MRENVNYTQFIIGLLNTWNRIKLWQPYPNLHLWQLNATPQDMYSIPLMICIWIIPFASYIMMDIFKFYGKAQIVLHANIKTRHVFLQVCGFAMSIPSYVWKCDMERQMNERRPLPHDTTPCCYCTCSYYKNYNWNSHRRSLWCSLCRSIDCFCGLSHLFQVLTEYCTEW